MSFVQAIKDSTEKLFPKLVDQLNGKVTPKKFNFTVSPRYGYSRIKEQYGIIYEYVIVYLNLTFSPKLVKLYFTSEVSMKSSFDRPPYCVGIQLLAVTYDYLDL